MTNTKKPTLATVKAFMRKNAANLFVKNEGDFNGMYDSFEYYQGERPFRSVAGQFNPSRSNDFGIGVWFVGAGGSSRNWIHPYSDPNGYQGFSVSNCCSAFVVAVKQ